jgi:hypothetical protein
MLQMLEIGEHILIRCRNIAVELMKLWPQPKVNSTNFSLIFHTCLRRLAAVKST